MVVNSTESRVPSNECSRLEIGSETKDPLSSLETATKTLATGAIDTTNRSNVSTGARINKAPSSTSPQEKANDETKDPLAQLISSTIGEIMLDIARPEEK